MTHNDATKEDFHLFCRVVYGILLQPSSTLPRIFQRSVRMVAHPPAAKGELQQEENHTEEETGSDASVIVQGETSVVKDQRTDQALRDVVGETHLAVGREAHQSVVQALVVVLNEEAEAEKQGKDGISLATEKKEQAVQMDLSQKFSQSP